MNGDVYALAVFDDGSGPALYAGGDFTTAGGVAGATTSRSGTARAGRPLGSGVERPGVHALAVFDDGSGPALYAGGDFTTAGGVPANHIAKWNGSSWSALGSGIERHDVHGAHGLRRRQRPGALRGRRLHDRGRRGGEHASRSGTARAGRRSGSGGRSEQRLRPRRSSTTAAVRRSTRAALHDRGRRGGEPHREVGRLELVGAGKRDGHQASMPSRSSTTAAARRSTRAALHDRGRRGGEQDREMGRLELVGAGQRDEPTATASGPSRSSTTAAARRSTRAATSHGGRR